LNSTWGLNSTLFSEFLLEDFLSIIIFSVCSSYLKSAYLFSDIGFDLVMDLFNKSYLDLLLDRLFGFFSSFKSLSYLVEFFFSLRCSSLTITLSFILMSFNILVLFIWFWFWFWFWLIELLIPETLLISLLLLVLLL